MFKREQRKICYMCQHFYRMHLRASELNIRRGILDLVKSASIFVVKLKQNTIEIGFIVNGFRVVATF